MKNLFNIYHEFFNDGDVEKFANSLNGIGQDGEKFRKVEVLSEERINLTKAVYVYLLKYGFGYEFSEPTALYKGSVWSYLVNGPTHQGLTVATKEMENLVDFLSIPNNFAPFIYVDSVDNGRIYYDGSFHITDKISEVEIVAVIRDAVGMLFYKLPMTDFNIRTKLLPKYATTGRMMQAVMYSSIGTELCDSICIDAIRHNTLISEWCMNYDTCWFDVTNQIDDGFVTMFREDSKTMVTCISTLYLGNFFITNMNAFKTLYENDLLSTIRFITRDVPVKLVKAGNAGDSKISNMPLTVPVFYDNDTECLVSDLVSENYIYHEVYKYNVGDVSQS